MPRDGLLFSDFDVFSLMENHKAALKTKIAGSPESLRATADEDELIQRFVREFEFQVPILREEEMSTTDREVDVDVSHDHRRFFSRSGPFYLKGTEITVHIPFIGDPDLFRVQPTTYTLSPPRGEIKGQELLLRFTFPNDMPPPDLKAGLDRSLNDIKSWLNHLRSSEALLSQQLKAEARSAWSRRKEEFIARSQDWWLGIAAPGEQSALIPCAGFAYTRRRGSHSSPNERD